MYNPAMNGTQHTTVIAGAVVVKTLVAYWIILRWGCKVLELFCCRSGQKWFAFLPAFEYYVVPRARGAHILQVNPEGHNPSWPRWRTRLVPHGVTFARFAGTFSGDLEGHAPSWAHLALAIVGHHREDNGRERGASLHSVGAAGSTSVYGRPLGGRRAL